MFGEYNITPSMSRHYKYWGYDSMGNLFGYLKEKYLRQFKKTIFKDQGNSLTNTFTFTNINN